MIFWYNIISKDIKYKSDNELKTNIIEKDRNYIDDQFQFLLYIYFYNEVYGKNMQNFFNNLIWIYAFFKINLPTNCPAAFPLLSNCLAQSSVAARCSDRD